MNNYSDQSRRRNTSPYDTRSYYGTAGQGSFDHMPDDRGHYDPRDAQTHWDRYNIQHYGGSSQHHPNESYRNHAGDYYSHYKQDDERYGSGNRPAGFPENTGDGRYSEGRYSTQQRYRHPEHHDIFERVGEGVTHFFDRITGHRHPEHRNTYPSETRYSGEPLEFRGEHGDAPRYNDRENYLRNRSNEERYGNRSYRGYERGHNTADDTPYRQQQIGDRHHYGQPDQQSHYESDYHRAGRNFGGNH